MKNIDKEKLSRFVANRLYEARKAKGYTGEEVGAILKMSKTSVVKYETSKILPSFATLIRLCIIYEVSPSYILGMDEKYSINMDAAKRMLDLVGEVKRGSKTGSNTGKQ